MNEQIETTSRSTKDILSKIGVIIKKIYNVISVISTLSILSWVVFLAIDCCFQPNISDNDIVMREIKNQLYNGEEVHQIVTQDLHGFGNNSVILVAQSPSSTICGEDTNNRLIVLDPVETSFFQKIHDPFGVKSKFTTTFSFELSSDEVGMVPSIDYVEDICGDTASEIIVSYFAYGSTYGSHINAIFSYSYEEQQYELIGTYPSPIKYDIPTTYDENQNIIGRSSIVVNGNPYSKVFQKEFEEVYRCSDGEKICCFNEYSYSSFTNYWINNTLVSVVDAHRYSDVDISDTDYHTLVNIYIPEYSDKNLSWRVVFSEYTDKIDVYSSESQVENFIDRIY